MNAMVSKLTKSCFMFNCNPKNHLKSPDHKYAAKLIIPESLNRKFE